MRSSHTSKVPVGTSPAQRFATFNGWEIVSRGFSLAQLGRRPPYDPWIYRSPDFPLVMHGGENSPRVMDHMTWFRLNRRPICLISQPYVPSGSLEAARAIAETYELDVFEAPKPKSGWYFPGRVTCLAFVPGHQASSAG